MSFNLKTKTVIDLVREGVLWVEDGNHGANRPLAHEFGEHGTPFVRPDDLAHGTVNFKGCDRISEQALKRVRKGKGKAGDIVFTHRATVGRIARVSADALDFVANPGVTVWRSTRHDVMDPNYLYYFMQTPFFMTQVWAEAGSTDTFPYISLTQQRALRVKYPPLAIQQEMGSTLGLLDDRITLLRETNATFEAIAQTLFKSWFVDFDPVRAKANGLEPEGMDAATAGLFPDSFEETELGVVPKGWRGASLADLAHFQNGYAFKSKDWVAAGHPVVKIGDVKPGVIDLTGCSFVAPQTTVGLDRFKLDRGSLLVGMTGYVGETGLVPSVKPSAYLNQRVGRFSTNNGLYDLGFVYCMVRNPAFKAFAETQSHGSAQANVSGTALVSYPTVMPSNDVFKKFNGVMAPILESILSNHEQVQTLTQLRDTLLPRLISGQLSLPEAEAQIEAVCV